MRNFERMGHFVPVRTKTNLAFKSLEVCGLAVTSNRMKAVVSAFLFYDAGPAFGLEQVCTSDGKAGQGIL